MTEKAKAMIFGVSIIAILIICIGVALSRNPIILGTEMNADGRVEYLCLGRGCEDYTKFKWRD